MVHRYGVLCQSYFDILPHIHSATCSSQAVYHILCTWEKGQNSLQGRGNAISVMTGFEEYVSDVLQ